MLRSAAIQRLDSLSLGFGKFAPGPPAAADPALIVIGLPGLVFITQGPSGQVKHPIRELHATCVGRWLWPFITSQRELRRSGEL